MAYVIKNNRIFLTRGDTFYGQVSIFESDGVTPYTPSEGDMIQFAVKKEATDEGEPLIVKNIPIDTMVLKLEPEDTKNLDFGGYYYDIQLTKENGDVDTFITKTRFVLTEEIG